MTPTDDRGRDDRGRLLPDTWRRPVLGVLGGMGPAATVAFLDALVRATPAGTDQEHIDTVVLNHATVPDRTARLKDADAEDPLPYLTGDLEVLARLGVDRVVIACNTLHAFLPPAADLPVPVLSLIEVGAEAVVAAARRVAGDGDRRPVVTLLATDGTLLSGVYQEALARLGAEVRLPDEAAQRQVMAMIYERVKAGVEVTTEEFEEFVDRQRAATGADAVLLGCTELSVLAEQAVQQHHDLPDHVVDAQMALVTRVVADLGPRSQA